MRYFTNKYKNFAKFFNISYVFFSNSIIKLLKYNKINNYCINLLNHKHSPYGLIYYSKLLELKILKTYIKANLANGFVKSFEYFVSS